MFGFNTSYGYSGELDFKNKLKIDEFIECLNATSEYIHGVNSIKLRVYEVLKNSNGECFLYLIEQFYNNEKLYSKYADGLMEVGYQKQKQQEEDYQYTYTRRITSRNWGKKKKRKKEQKLSISSSYSYLVPSIFGGS